VRRRWGEAGNTSLVLPELGEVGADEPHCSECFGVFPTARRIEVAPAVNLPLDLAVCAPSATIATYANDGGEEAALQLAPLMRRNTTLRFILVYTMPPEALRQAVIEVGAALRDRALTTLPVHSYSLEDIADARDAVEKAAVGKVVVEIP
jgi:NADPH:quinone reductase